MSAAAEYPALREERDQWVSEDMTCTSCGRVFDVEHPLGIPETDCRCPACGTHTVETIEEAPLRIVRLH